MSDAIFAAATTSDYDTFAGLVREYVDWCRTRHQEDSWFVDQALSYQSRKLCEAIIASAREDRFTLMRLDTASLLKEALPSMNRLASGTARHTTSIQKN